jgi:hypothetical protein
MGGAARGADEPLLGQALGERRFRGRERSGIIAHLARLQEQVAVERHARLDAFGYRPFAPDPVRDPGEPRSSHTAGQGGQPLVFQRVGGFLLLIDAVDQNDRCH